MAIAPLLRCLLILIVTCYALATGENVARAGGPPVSTAAQRQIVTQTLQAIQLADAGTLEIAETALVNQGEKIVPALQEALSHVQGMQRDVLDSALVRLTWKSDPRERVVQWVAGATHQDQETLRREHRPLPISDEVVISVFPAYRFYTLHFRMYPVARLAPAPLKTQNLFAVSRGSQITHLTDPESLKTFFETSLSLSGSGTTRAFKDATYAWLRLTQEFSWDGFFQFTISKEGITIAKKGHGWEASGVAVVTPKGGDRGQIEVNLSFDLRGHLTQVKETRNIQAGARPICQATKLLDPDPIVRAMAEQALVVMGISARDYLAERRALAAPALRQAIDRVWQRIVARERAMGRRPPRLDLTIDR